MSRRLPVWILIFVLILGLSHYEIVGLFDALILVLVLPRILDLFLSLLRLLSRVPRFRSLRLPYFVSAPWTVGLLWLFLSIKVAWVLFYAPQEKLRTQAAQQEDLLLRRDYLLHQIDSPQFGPETSPFFLSPEFKEEWAIGTLSMTAMALTQLAVSRPELRAQHLGTLSRLIERMLQPDIRIYEKRYWGEDALDSLSGTNGHIGYLGHLNLLLSLHRLLGGDETYETLHVNISNALARRIREGKHPFLETFPGQIFIPDNSVVIASLALHNRSLKSEQIEEAIQLWLTYTKQSLLDPETGIIVPWVNSDGRPRGRPRGSYATWNVFYLLQADAQFANEQAKKIREMFLTPLPFGACGIREYLPGLSGTGDIDSGPVIFGQSTSGTGFGLAAARVLKDEAMTGCLLLSAEIFGSTISLGDGRRYLLSPMIGDAIMLAMRTTEAL